MDKDQEKGVKWIIIILLIMLFFLIGYVAFGSYFNPDVYTYEGPGGKYQFNVIERGGITSHVVKVYVKDFEFFYPFRYGPKELEEIPIDNNVKNILNNDVLYISQDVKLTDETDSKSALAVIELNRITGEADYSIFKLPTITAVVEATNKSNELEIPEKNCENNKEKEGVIEIRKGEETKVFYEGDCLVVQGINGDEILKATDKLAYALLGVF